MRCYICDRILEEEHVQFNEEHRDYDPCQSCLAVIEGVFGDRPAASEDDFEDIPLDSLLPLSHDPFDGELT